MIHAVFAVVLLSAAAGASAQSAATKKELAARLLELQQPGLEALARGLAEQPAAHLLQQAAPVLQSRVAPDRREAVAKSIDNSTKRYFDEAIPLLRERALRLAPSTIGAAFESRLSEDELRQLVAWFESPINRKYQQLMPGLQAEFTKALVADARPAMDGKLKSLEQGIGNALGIAPAERGKGGKAEGKSGAKSEPKGAGR